MRNVRYLSLSLSGPPLHPQPYARVRELGIIRSEITSECKRRALLSDRGINSSLYLPPVVVNSAFENDANLPCRGTRART